LQDGWSGSDSEEEEFSRTVARISLRKSSSLPARRVVKRPSLPASVTRSNRYSDIGVGADGAKPSAVKERSADVVASRRATTSAIPSARPSGTAALITALVEQKYATKESLPRPKRFVSGWGAPEVLEDDEWPPDKLNGKLETLSEVW
jgi:hypothetical protein